MKIGVILGSIRRNRVGEAVATWVVDQAKDRPADYELVDLKQFDVPLLESPTVPAMANGHYDDPQVQAWGDKLAEFDGYIFVTAEYNHSVPGAFKNAIDSVNVELTRKAVAFVSYGADGGVRAVEHWRQILANLHMVDVRETVTLNSFIDFTDGRFDPQPVRAGQLDALFAALEKATQMTMDAR